MRQEPLQQELKPEDKSNEISLSNAAHPVACVFTIAFKIAAFLMYLSHDLSYFIIGNIFSDVNTFIIVVILSALDFWTVKNVTGRLLVGLRWWSDFDEKGKEVWKFESYDKQFKSNPVDATFFWFGQLASTGTWAAFLVIKILSLSVFWSLLCLINLSLSGINLYCYKQCRGEHNKKLNNLRNKLAGQATKTWLNNLIK